MSLRTYYMDDCTVPVPEGFRDRSTNVLEWKTPEGDAIALVVVRESIPEAPGPDAPPFDLTKFVEAQTKKYPTQFEGYTPERDEVAGPESGFQMRRKAFRWRNKQEVLYHHQAYVFTGDRVVVITAAAKARHRDSVDFLIKDVLDNFRVRGD